MTHLNVVPLVDEGLGNSAYLLDLGEERAMSGASLLARAGRTDLAVLAGGLGHWSTVTGEMLQVGA